jgi:hypothetical protein
MYRNRVFIREIAQLLGKNHLAMKRFFLEKAAKNFSKKFRFLFGFGYF